MKLCTEIHPQLETRWWWWRFCFKNVALSLLNGKWAPTGGGLLSVGSDQSDQCVIGLQCFWALVLCIWNAPPLRYPTHTLYWTSQTLCCSLSFFLSWLIMFSLLGRYFCEQCITLLCECQGHAKYIAMGLSLIKDSMVKVLERLWCWCWWCIE